MKTETLLRIGAGIICFLMLFGFLSFFGGVWVVLLTILGLIAFTIGGTIFFALLVFAIGGKDGFDAF